MEWGLTQGLAQNLQYDKRIEDLRYNEAQTNNIRRQQEALAMSKIKLLYDDFEMVNSTSPYDAPRILEDWNRTASELAKMSKENPNFAFDQNAQREARYKKNAFKTGENVLMATAYKDSMDQYKAILAESIKNPDKYNKDDLAKIGQQFKTYDQYGNPEGIDGKRAPMVFTPPQEIPDMDKLYMQTGNSIDPDDYKTLNNGRDGAYMGKVAEKTLRKKAEDMYARDPKLYDYLYTKHGKDPVQSIVNEVIPYTKTQYNPGQRNILADQMALAKFEHGLKSQMAAGAGPSSYDLSIRNTQRVVPGHEFLAEVFGTKVPFYYTSPDGNKQVKNVTDDFFYDGDLIEKGSGVKEAPGYFIQNLDWAKQQGYVYDPLGPSGATDDTDLEVRPEFKDKVEITPGKDKGRPVVKIKATGYFDSNLPVYRNNFDAKIARLTTKQRDAAGVSPRNENTSPQVGQIENGYEYVGGDPASANSWKKR